MSKSSGKTQTTTQTSDSAPWAGVQPFITDALGRGQQFMNRNPALNVSPFSPQSEQAMRLTEMRALNGSPVMNAGRGLAANTLEGDFLSPDSNPYLPYFLKRGMEGITPSINATFGGAGRTGSDAHATALGRSAGDFAGQLYGGAYDAERGRQMQTLGLAPQIAGQDYADINALMGVGQQVEGRANALNQAPWDNLMKYASLINGGYGTSGTSTTSQPLTSNPLGGALGGAMMGGALSGATGPLAALGPWGVAGGGILGLLGSL